MFDSASLNWIIAGSALALLELVVPGVYLIWFGFAAFVVSGITYFADIAYTTQLMWFAFFAVVFAVAGLYGYRYLFIRSQPSAEYKNLNNPAEDYVGQIVTLAQDVADNRTKVRIGDTYWLAVCDKPLKAGDNVKVTGVKDNLILIVE